MLLPINQNGLDWTKDFCHIYNLKCKFKGLNENIETEFDNFFTKIQIKGNYIKILPFIQNSYLDFHSFDSGNYLPGISIVDQICLTRSETCKINETIIEKLQIGANTQTEIKFEPSECTNKNLGDRFTKINVSFSISNRNIFYVNHIINFILLMQYNYN